jgi:hypothetical protein
MANSFNSIDLYNIGYSVHNTCCLCKYFIIQLLLNVALTHSDQIQWQSIFQTYHIFSWLATRCATRVTRWVQLMEQELPIRPEHTSSPLFLVGSNCPIFSFCVVFCRLLFVFIILVLVLPALLSSTVSNCPFGIFKLFVKLV